jgi:hypothetical protein
MTTRPIDLLDTRQSELQDGIYQGRHASGVPDALVIVGANSVCLIDNPSF